MSDSGGAGEAPKPRRSGAGDAADMDEQPAGADSRSVGWQPPPETAAARARRLAGFLPLLTAWETPTAHRTALTTAERELLTVITLADRVQTDLVVRLPGGIHRLPLLAAVLLAVNTLDTPQPDPADLLDPNAKTYLAVGPIALVTTRLVRRHEIEKLDAAGVAVAPALHPHRLRGDGLVAPMGGGRPRLAVGPVRLLFVSPSTGFPPVLGLPPRVVVIDTAADPDAAWLPLARQWAVDHYSHVLTFTDLHQPLDPLPTRAPAAWPQPQQGQPAAPQPTPDHRPDSVGELTWILDWPRLYRTAGGPATSAPPVHMLAVDDRHLARLADVRERLTRLRYPAGRPAPQPVQRAARLTRLLSELPTRTGTYDRLAPRYGGRTLRRLLDDVLDADPRNDFPLSWRARIAADWGAVRVGLTTVHDALCAHNPLADIVADLVEDAYRRHEPLDIVCGSRTIRDALVAHLLDVGTLRLDDPALVTLRSIKDIRPAGAHQNTVLIGPPAGRWRTRLAGADLGRLTVIASTTDQPMLWRALRIAFGQPSREAARTARTATLQALTRAPGDPDELDGADLHLTVTTQTVTAERSTQSTLPDTRALTAAALEEPPADKVDLDVTDLEQVPDVTTGDDDEAYPADTQIHRRVSAVPVVVQSTAALERDQSPVVVFLLPTTGRVQRLRDQQVQLLAVDEILPGMTLVGVSEPERRTLFDRIRPLLASQQPQVARLLLQMWRIALEDARALTGSTVELTARLTGLGAEIRTDAVAGWSHPDRIGPADPANIVRVARIAGSRVVEGEATRVAAVMRAARARNSAAGVALGKLAAWHAAGDTAALDAAAETLGADITDLAAELTTWRVITVGGPVLAPAPALRRPLAPALAHRLTQPEADAPENGKTAVEETGTDEIGDVATSENGTP